MDRIYAIGTATGPLNYFGVFSEAIAFWNYLQWGDGVSPPPCDLIGVHPEEITMTEIALLDRVDEGFMAKVNAANKRRNEIEQSRRILELQQAAPSVHSGADPKQGN